MSKKVTGCVIKGASGQKRNLVRQGGIGEVICRNVKVGGRGRR
jgi:hypothetical protein